MTLVSRLLQSKQGLIIYPIILNKSACPLENGNHVSVPHISVWCTYEDQGDWHGGAA